MCQSCANNTLLDNLIRHGLLIDTGVDGLYGRSGVFEDVVARFDDLITRWGGDENPEVMRFPPAMNRMYFEKSGYLKSFPQLAGTVQATGRNVSDIAAEIRERISVKRFEPRRTPAVDAAFAEYLAIESQFNRDSTVEVSASRKSSNANQTNGNE